MTYKTLGDWLSEQEGYGLRAERIPPGAYPWIAEAWKLAAEAALAARQEGEWQPISTAPQDWIIGYTSWGQHVGKFHEHIGPCEWFRDHHEFMNTDFDVFALPTHWKPYPKDRPADVRGPEQEQDKPPLDSTH